MTDPFGNYLIQKLLDRCSEEQRLQVLKAVAAEGQLVAVALNTHGTRAVQKLIETLTSREQTRIVVEALKGGVVSLIRDLNGNHVVQVRWAGGRHVVRLGEGGREREGGGGGKGFGGANGEGARQGRKRGRGGKAPPGTRARIWKH